MDYTLQQAAQAAIDVQNAANLPGVARTFADVMRVLNSEMLNLGQASSWRDRHPVALLFMDKMASLQRTQELSNEAMDRFSVAYKQCERYAAGEEFDHAHTPDN
jgi:hypothetical protein